LLELRVKATNRVQTSRVLQLLLSCIILLIVLPGYASDSLINYSFKYVTPKASEVYLVWTMNGWQVPAKNFQPEGTFVKDGMAYTKLNGSRDSFEITLKLPGRSYLDLMIYVPVDIKGDSVEGWDNNWEGGYNIYIDEKNTVTRLTDSKLAVTAKPKTQQRAFNLLKNGWIVLTVGASLLIAIIILSLFRRSASAKKFNITHFTFGMLVSSAMLLLVCRLQITGHFSNKWFLVLGLGYHDLLLMLGFAVISAALFHLTKRYQVLQFTAGAILVLLIILTALSGIMNIEVIRQLGKPLTYHWLYYSDFLQGADAKNALKAGFNPELTKNLLFIFCGLILASIAIGFRLKSLQVNTRKFYVGTASLLMILFLASVLQKRGLTVDQSKLQNPVTAFVLSWINSGTESELFTMEIPDDIRAYMSSIHQQKPGVPFSSSDSISHVIFFVLESTPSYMVEGYDTKFHVTPNLRRWQDKAILFENMYAHLPTTANTMLSLMSGVYPMISYKSIVAEEPNIKIESLASVLQSAGFQTALFFSSDLSYSKMGDYLRFQKMQTADDFKNIQCRYEKFNSGYAQLDGLPDRCIVDRYFTWRDTLASDKSFSILWTNQTHYPYFFSEGEHRYSDNAEQNKFLNALQEVDSAFGELMLRLSQRNDLNNTVVVVVGDHGEAFGTHNQYTHGMHIYEENLRVPCFIINPQLLNRQRDQRIAGMIDIAPSITHLLGLKQPDQWQGNTLFSRPARDRVFFIGPYSDFQFGSRYKNWKFIYNAANKTYQLFDLSKDPGELKNVAEQNPDVVKQEYLMLAAWVQYHTSKLQEVMN
jgi:arylsulfatase A-like enzyme